MEMFHQKYTANVLLKKILYVWQVSFKNMLPQHDFLCRARHYRSASLSAAGMTGPAHVLPPTVMASIRIGNVFPFGNQADIIVVDSQTRIMPDSRSLRHWSGRAGGYGQAGRSCISGRAHSPGSGSSTPDARVSSISIDTPTDTPIMPVIRRLSLSFAVIAREKKTADFRGLCQSLSSPVRGGLEVWAATYRS